MSNNVRTILIMVNTDSWFSSSINIILNSMSSIISLIIRKTSDNCAIKMYIVYQIDVIQLKW